LSGQDRRSEFTEYVAARRPGLVRLAYVLTGNWHTADDVVQTALARAYVAWPRIRSRGAEDAYVRQIILRAVVDESRRPWRREASGFEGFDTAATSDADSDTRRDLIAALKRLPEMQRRAVVLRHWWDLSVTETARDLNIPEGTVKSYTSRALNQLKSLMNEREAIRR
jgi:RNA polymerase sigma-70 factor (sigma-E family)